MSRSRAWIALMALVTALVGCGDSSFLKFGPIVAGVVRLDASLADAARTPTGTLRTTTADGVRVWLAEGGRSVDSTLTIRGAYAFNARKGLTYRALIGIPPGLTDSSLSIMPSGDEAAYLDTLLLERQGDLTSAPNPLTNRVVLEFSLATTAQMDLAIWDLSRRRVRMLASRSFNAGSHQLVWDARDDGGTVVPDGLYWAVLTIPSETRADLLVKQP